MVLQWCKIGDCDDEKGICSHTMMRILDLQRAFIKRLKTSTVTFSSSMICGGHSSSLIPFDPTLLFKFEIWTGKAHFAIIWAIVSFSTRCDVCRMAAVSKRDHVAWEMWTPGAKANHQILLTGSLFIERTYFCLCHSIFIDRGAKLCICIFSLIFSPLAFVVELLFYVIIIHLSIEI